MKAWFIGDFSVRGEGDLSLLDSPFAPGDIVIGNYEGVVNEVSKFEKNKVYLGQGLNSLTLAKRVGVTHFGVANNHVHDYGERAFESLVNALKASGFEVVGFRDKSGSHSSVTFRTAAGREVEVFFVVEAETGAVTDLVSQDGVRCCDAESEELLGALAKNRKHGVTSVVYVHWGETNYRYPSWKMRRLANEYVLRGARYVVGHHPHVVQGCEKKGSSDVFYSLGNFIFDEYASRKGVLRLPDENRDSLVIGVDFDQNSVELVRAVYDPVRREIRFSRDLGFLFRLYSYPLRFDSKGYSVFIRFYFAFRLAKRAVYWLHPARIRQVGPRQFGALSAMLIKLIGRNK